jgi:hypothetical protein
MVWVDLLTSSHVLNRVHVKNKEKTPYEECIRRKRSLYYLRTWGCLVKVNMSINKKRKLSSKTVDCLFGICSPLHCLYIFSDQIRDT